MQKNDFILAYSGLAIKVDKSDPIAMLLNSMYRGTYRMYLAFTIWTYTHMIKNVWKLPKI